VDGVEAVEEELGEIAEKSGVAEGDKFAGAEGEEFAESLVDLGGSLKVFAGAEDLGDDGLCLGGARLVLIGVFVAQSVLAAE
jgi:hypothetical protein